MADKVLVHNHGDSWQKTVGTAEAVLAEQVPELRGRGAGGTALHSFLLLKVDLL